METHAPETVTAGDNAVGDRRSSLRAALSFAIWIIIGIFIWKTVEVSWGHWQTGSTSDFYYFWSAGRDVLAGEASRAYTTHATGEIRLWPLPHPPPLLLFTPVLALLPVRVSLLVWLGVTGLAYIITARQRLRVALANPTVPYNVRWGQTGFFTSSILFGGVNALVTRPWVGGAILGLMVVKPNLAPLIPVALVAGRHWKALSAAGASVAVQIALAAIAFGSAIYVQWWNSARLFAGSLQQGSWAWSEVSSSYAFLRWWGLNSPAAFVGQAVTAAGAALLVRMSWAENWDSKVPVLAAATMLVPPYLCSHDAVMMVAPLGWFAARSAWRAGAIWLLLLVPWFDNVLINSQRLPLDLSGLPDTTPIAAALSLFFLWAGQKKPSPAYGWSRRNWRP